MRTLAFPPPPQNHMRNIVYKCISWCKFSYAQTLCFLSNYLNLAQFVLLTRITFHIYHFVNLRLFEIETSQFRCVKYILVAVGSSEFFNLTFSPSPPITRIHVTSAGKPLTVITITSDRLSIWSNLFESSLKETISILFSINLKSL